MRQRRIHPWTWLVLLPTVVILAGCGSGEKGQTPVAASIHAPTAPAGGSAMTSTAAASPPSRPSFDLVHPEVTVETTAGRIVIRLDAEHAPGTVANFLSYVNSGHFDGTCFHYVSPGDMILGGGFSPQLELRPTAPPIRNEAHNMVSNTRGSVAMSRSLDVIDSATSQFFINLADHQNLDYHSDAPSEYGYCVFGRVILGLDVAEKIAQVPTTSKGEFAMTPTQPVVIHSIRQSK